MTTFVAYAIIGTVGLLVGSLIGLYKADEGEWYDAPYRTGLLGLGAAAIMAGLHARVVEISGSPFNDTSTMDTWPQAGHDYTVLACAVALAALASLASRRIANHYY